MNGSQQALEQACAGAGLDPDGARLLRVGSNAVYHLRAPVIARVSRPGTDIAPVRRAVAVARWLESEHYQAFFTATQARLQDAYDALPFVLPQGVIHGDASVGNVLRDRHGVPVLIDLDGFTIGPREWHLVLTAMYYDSFGWHTREEYEGFARVYGCDIMRWPGVLGP